MLYFPHYSILLIFTSITSRVLLALFLQKLLFLKTRGFSILKMLVTFYYSQSYSRVRVWLSEELDGIQTSSNYIVDQTIFYRVAATQRRGNSPQLPFYLDRFQFDCPDFPRLAGALRGTSPAVHHSRDNVAPFRPDEGAPCVCSTLGIARVILEWTTRASWLMTPSRIP